MKLNCVVTDDEPISQEVMEDYIRVVPGLNLVAMCDDVAGTLKWCIEYPVDVLFINIRMQAVKGLHFLRSVKKPPLIVFTSAHAEHAIEGFELDAVDYLLKPVSFERFLRTADKLFQRCALEKKAALSPTANNSDDAEKKYFFLKTNTGLVKIELDKLLYVEGLENYIKVICQDKTVISLNTMKNMESLLLAPRFLRIHRSYIVNMDKVDAIQENCFCLGNTNLTIGKSYRKPVTDMLKRYFAS